MSPTSWQGALAALPLLAGSLLAAPAAEARAGFGITVPRFGRRHWR